MLPLWKMVTRNYFYPFKTMISLLAFFSTNLFVIFILFIYLFHTFILCGSLFTCLLVWYCLVFLFFYRYTGSYLFHFIQLNYVYLKSSAIGYVDYLLLIIWHWLLLSNVIIVFLLFLLYFSSWMWNIKFWILNFKY